MSQGNSPISKNSPKPKPLRAVLPITSCTKDVSSFNWKSENSSPLLTSPTSSRNNRPYLDASGLRSPGALNSKSRVSSKSSIRRTASFDTVYFQTDPFFFNYSFSIDKSTQTTDGSKSGHKLSEEEKVEKFFCHRFQRKDSQNSGSNFSSSTPPTEHITTQTIPNANFPFGTPVHKNTTIRNSVEGLNLEIERLVLNTCLLNVEDKEISEGHRAPLAEIFRLTRSVDTQTPGDAYTPNSVSSGPPSRGDSESPLRRVSADSSPGEGDHGPKTSASPKINKFLAREPPDGCEKVNLKFFENLRKPMCDVSLSDYPPMKPSLNFQLRPSLGSAFHSLASAKVEKKEDPTKSVEDEVQK